MEKITKSKTHIYQILIIAVSIVPFIIIPVTEYGFTHNSQRIYALSALVMAYLLIILKNRKQIDQFISFDPININLSLYVLFLAVSLFFAESFSLAFSGSYARDEGFLTLIIYFLLFLAARSIKLTDYKFFNYLMISAAVLALYGILQFFGIDPLPRPVEKQNYFRAFSTFSNPNFFGSYLMMMLPVALFMFVKTKKNSMGLNYAIILFSLFCTLTRSALIGAIVSVCLTVILIWFYTERKTYENLRITCVVIISIFVTLSFNLISESSLQKRFNSISSDAITLLNNEPESENLGNGRIYIWVRVIQLIREKPLFGHGIENLGLVFTDRFSEDITETFGRILIFDRAHNEYLHIAVSSGIPALLVYLFFIGLVLKKGVNNIKNSEILLPVMAAITGYLVQAFFNISVVPVAYIFWILLGFVSHYQIAER
ncbi:O-antigen polymerase [Chitinispirillum alkaliphilum]|nr:O-antigen polymerase [Chitinispirillum alkaliphilum]